jgi:hypothetical protein
MFRTSKLSQQNRLAQDWMLIGGPSIRHESGRGIIDVTERWTTTLR